ncbi:hypothetical protein NZK35_25735 [Stieleria sp. ICT_E10.1]|uniref:GP88 family protein n=1 Tax=Stieleria sedimenti TaxID=2976331 RepID=UPI0021806ED6|nr:hypothetical protein [Stieleria sedimenti]MCS7470060.1 hypothetical protein [Stieleria sedimenti]
MLLRTNAKLEKLAGLPYLSAGLTLAPHNLSGHNVCAGASNGCAASCVLWFAGLRVSSTSRHAALRDTQWLRVPRPPTEPLHSASLLGQQPAFQPRRNPTFTPTRRDGEDRLIDRIANPLESGDVLPITRFTTSFRSVESDHLVNRAR